MEFLKLLGIVLISLSGALLGRGISRLRSPFWAAGFVLPMLLISVLAVARRYPALEQSPWFAWLMAERSEFAAAALMVPMLMATLIHRTPSRNQKVLLGIFTVLATLSYGLLPFLMPLLNRDDLARIDTLIDPDGVCLQSNDYNCGPAAAVTVLRRLGIDAREGRLAIRSHANAVSGVQPDSLRAAIREIHGISCRIIQGESAAELKPHLPAIAVVKFRFLVDHYVAVLGITESQVVVGDPISGLRRMEPETFEGLWRGVALEVGGGAGALPGAKVPRQEREAP